MYDVIIVGGGPAGLSAALVLGRCLRRVLVCDDGRPRNGASHGVHGYLTRDGVSPDELRALGWAEIERYNVAIHKGKVAAADCIEDSRGFRVTLEDGEVAMSRKLLIATGVRDILPPLPGMAEMYGISARHCPYCDGYEWRHQPVAVYGQHRRGIGLALKLCTWTSDLTLCTDGRPRLRNGDRELLARHKIALRTEQIERLEHQAGRLQRVVFRGGDALERKAIFFNHGIEPGSDLPQRLGCSVGRHGVVMTDRKERAGVPGLWVAGDASKDVQFVIVAAAEGAKAGVAINTELQAEEGLEAK